MLKNERNLKSNRTDYDLVFPSGNRVTRRKVLHTFKRQEEVAWRKDLEGDVGLGHNYMRNNRCAQCNVPALYAKNNTIECAGEWWEYEYDEVIDVWEYMSQDGTLLSKVRWYSTETGDSPVDILDHLIDEV